MFVYQADKLGSWQSAYCSAGAQSVREERRRRAEGSQSLLVVLCALVFGGISKTITFVPLAGFVATVMVMAWFLGDDATAEEPSWVNRLSLASTGLFYLGLGHCVGVLGFLVAPLIWSLFKPE